MKQPISKIRTALVEHPCDECSEPIKVGVTYVYQSNIDENGNPYTRRVHVECSKKEHGDA